jgi:hypothetical protein
MPRRWIALGPFALILFATCGGNHEAAGAPAASAPSTPAAAEVPRAASGEGAAAPRKLPLDVPNAKQLVRDLIEAFQAGDRARVEALWARDGGTWTDQAGFEKRASGYREMLFDLDLEAMETGDRGRAIAVVVHAKKEGAPWNWVFLVSEIGGALRAGGVEVQPAGVP